MGNQLFGEVTAQTLVEATVTLRIPAVKIDEIKASITDLTCTLIPGKVIFQGALHEQIFFVDEGGLVRHQAEDLRFSGFIPLTTPGEGVECRGQAVIEFIGFKLLSPSTLQQVIRPHIQTYR